MPNLIGVHQITNAITAIMALLKLQIPIKNICDGMRYAIWPARLEKINYGKLEKIIATLITYDNTIKLNENEE